ncbi:MAG: orotate phosphoribosyltransferase [Candidatus Helarchaeota archaeon]
MQFDQNSSLDFLKFLIYKNGLLFGSFKLKSKRISPYFFNLANIIVDGEGLLRVSEIFAKFIHDNIGLNNFDFIFGPAYKGIPLASVICQDIFRLYKINKRWGFDRKESKDYGDKTEQWLVGKFEDNDRILIIDDVITTGLTKIDTCEKIKKFSGVSNLQFIGVVILLDRQEKNSEGQSVKLFLKNLGLTIFPILKIKDIYDQLYRVKIDNKTIIDDQKFEEFNKYFKKYGTL